MKREELLKYYVDLFNKNDEEIYKNDIGNKHAYEWLKQEIPLFECSDKEFEKVYYFRWWTYRKHIKSTDDGYVVTEFLPKVLWSDKNNVISAPVGHHIFEGRWLKNSKHYLKDYINYYLDNPDSCHVYSTWFCYSIFMYAKTIGEFDFGEDFLEKLCRYYELWEEKRELKNGMFWSYDGEDAMEFSISGTPDMKNRLKGIRPTLNCYMCADAWAIAQFAKFYNDKKTEEKYTKKYEQLKSDIDKLFVNGFYRAFHYKNDSEALTAIEKNEFEPPRELIGYIPWMFNIPKPGNEDLFFLLSDEKYFKSEYGITTVERNHEKFLYKADHECLWNGYVWPYATSQTLTALINVINNYPHGDKYKKLFIDILVQYAKSHKRIREDGKEVPWIDEVRHPLYDDWSSRTILKRWNWKEEKGGYERGKDYNHSTFNDLVISGIVGVNPEAETLEINPAIPEEWDYFKLSDFYFKGNVYTVLFDRTGSKYNMGKGIHIINGQKKGKKYEI